jgi:phosphate transport system permease protein
VGLHQQLLASGVTSIGLTQLQWGSITIDGTTATATTYETWSTPVNQAVLLLVPGTMREGALALGATRARAVFTVVLPAALPGIVTGVVLALARIAGETAPLLFTAFNNQYFSTSLTQPISSLTVQVYTYATGPYDDWHRQAWAGALVLVSIVLICSLLARLATRRLERMHAR